MANEKLVVTMEARDQLSPALKKVGAAAGETATEIEKITSQDVANFGRGMLQGATKLATGLYGLAKASSDLAEAQNFSNQIFKDAAPAINDFAKKAATAIGMSERAALDAAASVGIFGQRIELTGEDLANFSTNLVTLAADMASIKNTKPEEAVTAIAAAMRNEYEPIRRYGVVLNDVVLKARALEQGTYDGTGQLTQQQKILAVNAELYDQLGFAIGDFNRTQDELANQTRIAQAQFENLQANLGDALRPAFINLTSAANDALAMFMKLPDPVKEIAASVALVGTGLLGLGGAVVFTVGKVGTLIENFSSLRTRLRESAAQGSRSATALMGIGKVAGVVGAGAAAFTVLTDAVNTFNDVAGQTKRGLEEMNIAMGKADVSGLETAFSRLVAAEANTTKFSDIWEDQGRTFNVMSLGIVADIEEVDKAFGRVRDSSPDAAAKLIESWKEVLPTLDAGSQEYKDLKDMIDRYTPTVERAVQSQQALGGTYEFSAETLAKFGDETIDAGEAQKELEAKVDSLVDALKEYAEMMVELRKNMDEAERSFDTAGERAEAFADGLAQSTGTNELLDNVVDLSGALADMDESFRDSEGHIDATRITLDHMTDAGRDNIKAVDDLASIMNDRLLMVYKASGGSIEEVTAAQAGMVEEFDNMLRAAGVSEEAIGSFNAMLNQTPESIKVAIELEGQEVARQKLDMLNIEFDKIPPTIATAIQAEMDEGDFISAYQLASNFIADRPLEYNTRVDDPTTPMNEAIGNAQAVADSNPVEMPTTAESVMGLDAAIGAAQGAADANPVSVDMTVKPGDVETPTRQNRDYAKNNPPETEIKTEPGDYETAHGEIEGYTESHDPVTTVKTEPGPFQLTWALIAIFFATHPVTVLVKAEASNIQGTWAAIAVYFATHPVTVLVKPDPSGLGAAWSEIQSYFSGHPITVRVNTVAGTVRAPVVGASAAQPSAAEAGAMSAMGLTAVGDTLLAVPSRVRAGVEAPSSTPAIINLNVNMPVGTNEARVVDLLRQYARSNGTRSYRALTRR